jgi:hypothetical protein
MRLNNQFKSDLIEEKLWNEQYLFPVTKKWNTSVVLCCYERTQFDPLKKLARLFANKVDHQFGCLKKGKARHISQRIEKLQMLEYGEDKRGWHFNTFLNCPKHIDQFEFMGGMREIWLNIILKPWQVRCAREYSDLFWAEEAIDGFYKYCVKKRAEQASIPRFNQIIGITKTPNDLIPTETLTIHESNTIS